MVSEVPPKPKIPTKIYKDDRHEVNCTVHTYKPSKVTWYKINEGTKETEIKSSETTSKLSIDALQEGEYMCEAENEYGASQSIIMKLDCRDCSNVSGSGETSPSFTSMPL